MQLFAVTYPIAAQNPPPRKAGSRIPPGGPKQKAPQTAQLCGLWSFFLFSFRASQKRKTSKKTGKSAYDASQMQVKAAPRTAAFRAVRRPKFFTLFCNTGQKENPGTHPMNGCAPGSYVYAPFTFSRAFCAKQHRPQRCLRQACRRPHRPQPRRWPVRSAHPDRPEHPACPDRRPPAWP